jgi:hypothetical protein
LLLNHFGVEIVKVLRDLARHKIFTTETTEYIDNDPDPDPDYDNDNEKLDSSVKLPRPQAI